MFVIKICGAQDYNYILSDRLVILLARKQAYEMEGQSKLYLLSMIIV